MKTLKGSPWEKRPSPGWLEQRQSLVEHDDYEIRWLNGNRTLGTGYTQTSYATYAVPGWAGWQNYEYSGRMRLSQAGAQMGVTLYNALPGNSLATYRLSNPANGSFTWQALGTTLTGALASSVTPQPETWYHFRAPGGQWEGDDLVMGQSVARGSERTG